MPMTMEGAFTVRADRPTVWARLHDPAFLKQCLQECEALQMIDSTLYVGVARVRLGPLNTLFHGRIDLSDVDPPHGWRMIVRGAGGLAGRARGVARVQLRDTALGTAVAYTLEASFGTRVSPLGNRLIGSAARRVADRFFANVSAAVLAAGAAS